MVFNGLVGADDYYQRMVNKLEDGTKSSLKSWWQTVKYFSGRNSDSNIPPIDNGNKISYSNFEKAEPFNIFFWVMQL